jgi:hypothetical protein
MTPQTINCPKHPSPALLKYLDMLLQFNFSMTYKSEFRGDDC